MALRCLIVDDSTGFVRSARMLLERQGVTVVGMASTGEEAVQRTQELQPDVVLLDIDLGEESGFDVARRLERESTFPPSNVILISTHAEEDFTDLIVASPSGGFVSKADLSASAIRKVLRGTGDGNAATSRVPDGASWDS